LTTRRVGESLHTRRGSWYSSERFHEKQGGVVAPGICVLRVAATSFFAESAGGGEAVSGCTRSGWRRQRPRITNGHRSAACRAASTLL